MRRRAAVEPMLGHLKAEHRIDRKYLKGRDGDRANAALAAAGYNFGLLLRWLQVLLRALIQTLLRTEPNPAGLKIDQPRYFADDLEGCAMGPVLHSCAKTTDPGRQALQDSQETRRGRYGINLKTVAKWKKRKSVKD